MSKGNENFFEKSGGLGNREFAISGFHCNLFADRKFSSECGEVQ